MRPGAALLCSVFVLAACSGDDANGPAAGSDSTTVTSTTSVAGDIGADDPAVSIPVPAVGGVSADLNGVVLARALVQQADLPGYDVRTPLRAFHSDTRPGLLICGEDLRADTGLTEGVQAVFVRDDLQVTVTVTAGTDSSTASGFLERFGQQIDGCTGPWSQEAGRLGDEPLEAELLGPVDIGDPGVAARAVRLRTTSSAGSSDVAVAVLAIGPVLSAVTVAGPVDADLADVTDVVAAAARRAGDLVRQLG